MSDRNDLADRIAAITSDYRSKDSLAPTAVTVLRWVEQFEGRHQEQILSETAHVLGQTYVSRASFEAFLQALLTNPSLVGSEVEKFWGSVGLLDIQTAGHSQSEMLVLLKNLIKTQLGVRVLAPAASTDRFIYIDDGIFTGNRALRDLRLWIERDAPATCSVDVIVIALHLGGSHYVRQRLLEVARSVGKEVRLTFWRAVEIEDRRSATDISNVLRPTMIPDDPATESYVSRMQYQPVLRRATPTPDSIFSGEQGRSTLEQEFLKAGVKIRTLSPTLVAYQRPLGNSVLETLGFGTMIVTFRNCPNNAPLALWAGSPWHPLLPRRTN